MADLLTSITLFATILAVVFAVWYPDIVKEIGRKMPRKEQTDECSAFVREVRGVAKTRSMPLLIASLLMSLTFLPDTFDIARQACSCLNPGVTCHYSSVRTAFVLAHLLLFGFFVLTVTLSCRLFAVANQCKQRAGDYVREQQRRQHEATDVQAATESRQTKT